MGWDSEKRLIPLKMSGATEREILREAKDTFLKMGHRHMLVEW